MANSGGGFVILGFLESGGSLVGDLNRPNLSAYSSDAINSVVGRFAEPAFHVDVVQVRSPRDDLIYPVIVVPGDSTVPVRTTRASAGVIQQNVYYIRRPGPKSEPPQTASEWDQLLQRCLRNQQSHLRQPPPDAGIRQAKQANEAWLTASLERYAQIAEGTGRPRFSLGSYIFSYQVSDFQRLELGNLRQHMLSSKGRETGWPVWWVPDSNDIAPYPYGDGLECYIGIREDVDDAHADYWRASPNGSLFLVRGFQEDSDIEGVQPGKFFDFVLPIWRVGEAILHSYRFSRESASRDAEINFTAVWRGLSGRTLDSVARRSIDRSLFERYISRENEVRCDVAYRRSDVRNNVAELVETVTRRLYASFNLFVIDPSVVREEVKRMMQGI